MRSSPPQILLRLFRWFCHPELHPFIEGDLLELYEERVKEKGRRKAQLSFAKDVLLLFRPGIIRPFNRNHSLTHYDMYKNYLKMAIRNLFRRKVYSGINILGLSIGIACCLLIFQYVAFEYSFDVFNKNAATIYRVNQMTIQAGEEPEVKSTAGWALGPALAQEVPEVKHFVRLHLEYNKAVISNPAQPDKTFEEEWVYYADSTFFKMFSYPMVVGDPNKVFSQPGTVMLSESMAKKYFGNEDPMGQMLNVNGWIDGSYRVDGIFKDVPANSHLKFDVLLSMTDLLTKSEFSNPSTGWNWTNFITYVQLSQEASTAVVDEKFTDIFRKNRKEKSQLKGVTEHLFTQPLLDIHLNEDIRAPKAVMGSQRTVYFFAIIGFIILLIALVNYINLTTARALDRALEVGVRQVIGAKRGQLILQFLTESVLTIFMAFVLAVLLAESIKPFVNHVAGMHLTSALWMSPKFWVAFGALFCTTLLLAGMYPALVLSSFKPIVMLKGKKNKSSAHAWLRKVLVIFQFATSIVLLVGTAIVYTQLNYMRTMDLGIDIEQILTVSSPRVFPEEITRANALDTFIKELSKLSTVQQAATSASLPGQGFNFQTGSIKQAGADPSTNVPGAITWIDHDFDHLYGLELLVGKGFNDISIATADQDPRPVIANETAIYALGFETPEKALHQNIDIANGNLSRIVGIYKDFHWSSAHRERGNFFYYLGHGLPHISIKVNTENLPQTIAAIETTYEQLFPGNPFLYAFVNEIFESQYQNDHRFARLFNLFAALAIFIACLGLFGMATFTAQQRKNEIGIRKVLGATLTGVLLLLSRDFLKLVMIGFWVAVPIAWYTMDRWLEEFAYRIEINAGVFLLAGLAAALIAIVTISWQSLKVALVNPADSLRDE